MPAPRKTGDEDHIISLYQRGLTLKQVAREAKTSPNRVSRILHGAGATRAAWDSRGRWRPPSLDEFLAAYDGGQSVKSLADQHGVARHVIGRVLAENDRAPRTRSQAERLKWSQMPESERKAQVRAAHSAVTGVKKGAEWLERQAQSRARLQHKASPKEYRIADWLREREVLVTHQLPIGKYNADLAVHPLVVEQHAATYLQPSRPDQIERVMQILDAGWSMLVIADQFVPITPGCADYAISYLEELRRDPAAGRQYRVIDGAGQVRAVGRADADHITVEFPHRRGEKARRVYARPRK